MKVIVVLVLLAIGVFLFRRAQRLAKEEQDAMMAQRTTEKTVAESASKAAEVNEAKSVEPAPSPEMDTVKEVEAELMPRESESQPSVDISDDIIEVDVETTKTEAEVEFQTTPVSVDVVAVEEVTPAPAIVASAPSVSHVIEAPGLWANDTLNQIFSSYQQATFAVERYNAVQNLIAECYKQRKTPDYLHYGANLSSQYLALFHDVSAEAELKTTGFMHLATLLNDTHAFDKAIALCKQALALGLTDGTVTGFEGRINRIEKAQAKAAAV
ncbi:hypothetical protein [Shewanella acanthi]|uniref:hypothetical protein n=1 Tax=Shewanella acanthi TaxID=2864212 RepID=UPI001C65C85E|nr:hypothetical protein [Shewanella acanthi]QYJ78600.1 hypothetical protein K0H61_16175 [Shewanella acanthi]